MRELDEVEALLMTRLQQVYGGKSWIVAGDAPQGVSGVGATTQSVGAARSIVIAFRFGVGELSDGLRFILIDDPPVDDGASMVERMRDDNRELHDLPTWARGEVAEWGPGNHE